MPVRVDVNPREDFLHVEASGKTIKELLGGKKIDYLAPMSTSRTFKKAPKAQTKEQEQKGLFQGA